MIEALAEVDMQPFWVELLSSLLADMVVISLELVHRVRRTCFMQVLPTDITLVCRHLHRLRIHHGVLVQLLHTQLLRSRNAAGSFAFTQFGIQSLEKLTQTYVYLRRYLLLDDGGDVLVLHFKVTLVVVVGLAVVDAA